MQLRTEKNHRGGLRDHKALCRRFALGLGACVAAIFFAELSLRLLVADDSFIRGREWNHWRENSELAKQAFIADPELGYVPRMDTGLYDEQGAFIAGKFPRPVLGDHYKKRILLLGDSVTARRKIESALRKEFGDSSHQFWNCGVEGYNTFQEVAYYERYCQEIRPDHLILTFSQNDFDVTPVAFYDGEGRMAVYSPDRASNGLDPWLYQHSYIYRLWFSWRVAQESPFDDAAGAKSIRESLARLQALLGPQGSRLTVLVMPPCKEGEWSDRERARQEMILTILRELGIQHVDLAPGLSDALEDRVPVQETKGDHLHPSAELADRFARQLQRQGFLL